jgi:hypothetical protein
VHGWGLTVWERKVGWVVGVTGERRESHSVLGRKGNSGEGWGYPRKSGKGRMKSWLPPVSAGNCTIIWSVYISADFILQILVEKEVPNSTKKAHTLLRYDTGNQDDGGRARKGAGCQCGLCAYP